MAEADEVISIPSVETAPKEYTVPGAQEILLKCVRATFDGAGAGGDFLPTLEIVSPAGQVSGTFTADSAVAAGASAAVSWFPGVKAAKASGAAGIQAQLLQAHGAAFFPNGGGPVVIADSTVAELGWTSIFRTTPPTCLDWMDIGGGSAERVTVAAGGALNSPFDVTYTIQVNWPSFTGLRYVEVAPDNGDPFCAVPQRIAGHTTPDDDVQVLTGTFSEQTGALTGMVVRCFQQSGGPVAIVTDPTAQFFAIGPTA